ncbi:MAG: hypothetical protein EOO96_11505 [Pedobacter sp.]|nr:MAG: hypothetical protein EOO96_11505 [Pedobacter sp.]
MKKGFNFFMIAIVAIISFSGCKKNTPEDPITDNCKLTNVERSNKGFPDYNATITYEGDKIKTISSGSEIITYTYGANTITIKNNDQYTYDDEVLTLVGGKISKLEVGGYTNNYNYNSEGYLIGIDTYEGQQLIERLTLTYTNGNLTSSLSGDPALFIRKETTYEFSSELSKPNFFLNTPHLNAYDTAIVGDYLGKLSKNQLVKSTSKTYVQGTVSPISTTVNTYQYTKDATGNFATGIHKFETTDAGGTQETTISEKYTFTCN